MDQGFIDILQKLVAEQGKQAILDASKCKAFLTDYASGDFKKESHLLLQALDINAAQAIDSAGDLAPCKEALAVKLNEEHFIALDIAADIVNVLALVLRGDKSKTKLKKSTKEVINKETASPKNQAAASAGASGAEPLVKRGQLFLEDSDWEKADEYFDRALDIDPEHAPAYIGKLCAELQVRREDSLGDYQELRQGRKIDRPLGEYAHFQKAIRFADTGYRSKLNAYDQKIKESLPKTIPQMFTDEYVHSEIARLKKEIADCDEGIAEEKKISDLRERNRQIYINSGHIIYDETIEMYNKYANESWQRVKDLTANKADCEAKKQMLDPLAGLSCLDRMDGYYNQLVKAMKMATAEDKYKILAEQFRVLEGYEDSSQLADECDRQASVIKEQREERRRQEQARKVEAKYNDTVAQFNRLKNKMYNTSADLTEAMQEYDALVATFKELSTYKNTDAFVEQCQNNRKECESKYAEAKRKEEEEKKKTTYDKAVLDFQYLSNKKLIVENDYKNAADEYNSLASTFYMLEDYYGDAKNLNEQCKVKYKEFNALYLKIKEEHNQREAKEKTKAKRKEKLRGFITGKPIKIFLSIIALIALALLPVFLCGVSSALFYNGYRGGYRGFNIMNIAHWRILFLSLGPDNILGGLIAPAIFLIPSLAILHFRDGIYGWQKFSIVVISVMAVFYLITAGTGQGIIAFIAFVAIIISLIMALALPLRKIMDM